MLGKVCAGSVVAFLAIMSLPNPADAVTAKDFELMTTQDLYDVCSVKTEEKLARDAVYFCTGFFSGAIAYHDSITGPDSKRIVCAPEGTTRNDAVLAFIDWAKANNTNNELMNAKPLSGAIRAAQAKWPCVKK